MVLFYDTVFFINMSSSSQHIISVALFYILGSSLLYTGQLSFIYSVALFYILGSSLLYTILYNVLYNPSYIRKESYSNAFQTWSHIIYKLYNIHTTSSSSLQQLYYILFYFREKKRGLLFLKFNYNYIYNLKSIHILLSTYIYIFNHHIHLRTLRLNS